MSLTHLGDACAHFPAKHAGEKPSYVRIGSAFQDSGGRVAIKIDTLPINPHEWSGWVNVFPKKEKDRHPAKNLSDDDIPF